MYTYTIKKDDAIYKIGYEEDNPLLEKVHNAAHCGLTYSLFGIRDIDKGWWIGWDYAHVGDYCAWFGDPNDKKWTTQEMYEDVLNVINAVIEVNDDCEVKVHDRIRKD